MWGSMTCLEYKYSPSYMLQNIKNGCLISFIFFVTAEKIAAIIIMRSISLTPDIHLHVQWALFHTREPSVNAHLRAAVAVHPKAFQSLPCATPVKVRQWGSNLAVPDDPCSSEPQNLKLAHVPLQMRGLAQSFYISLLLRTSLVPTGHSGCPLSCPSAEALYSSLLDASEECGPVCTSLQSAPLYLN